MTMTDINGRFVAAITALIASDPNANIGIAVSGGPDSLALLLLAHANFGGRVYAATVDHQLRPEAAEEAAFVAQLCHERQIPHRILRPHSPITGNLQSAARTERYRLLKDWAIAHNCPWVATAHHAEDQLETLLMRMTRGSGVSGMAGIRARNGVIIRPLLGFHKADLIAVCAAAGIQPIEDPSNADRDFDRVRIRQWLASGHPLGTDGPARTASAMAEAEEALDWMMPALEKSRIVETKEGVEIEPTDLPRELQRRLLVAALHRLDADLSPRGPALDLALAALRSGAKTSLGNIICTGGKTWMFVNAPPRNA